MPLPPLICRLVVASPDEMHGFGARLAPVLAAGDCLGLKGDLGAGKSTLARAIIGTALSQSGIDAGDIPSPTFTLVQPYPHPAAADPGREIWHLDLWRLETPDEVIELGLEEALERHISLIEWPERMGPMLPTAALMIVIERGDAPEERRLGLHGHDGWASRLKAAGIDPSV